MSAHVSTVESNWCWLSALATPYLRPVSVSAVLKTRAFLFPGLVWSLAVALAAVACTAFLPSVGRNDGSLLDVCTVCGFEIGISQFRFVSFSRRICMGYAFCLRQVSKSVNTSAPSPFFRWIRVRYGDEIRCRYGAGEFKIAVNGEPVAIISSGVWKRRSGKLRSGRAQLWPHSLLPTLIGSRADGNAIWSRLGAVPSPKLR
jgi:hypothetical protein